MARTPTPLAGPEAATRRRIAGADSIESAARDHAKTNDRHAKAPHPARATKRRAARKHRGVRAQRAALSPRGRAGARAQAAALRPRGAGRDGLMDRVNRDAAREGADAPSSPADAYRQRPDLLPPRDVRQQMRREDAGPTPVEQVEMEPLEIEAELPLAETRTVGEAGRMLVDVWKGAAEAAAEKVFGQVVVKALAGRQPQLIDQAQDLFFDMLPGPVGKIRASLESTAAKAAPSPAAQAHTVVSAFRLGVEVAAARLYAYVEHHQLEAAKMAKDRDGKIQADATQYLDIWMGAPFFLPGPTTEVLYAKVQVRLWALYYQAMANATCAKGGGSPGLCVPEKMADPRRWEEDAERKAHVRHDGRINYAEEKMGW